METQEKEDTEFTYQFSSNGTRYKLCVPVQEPLSGVRARELASRVVRAHNVPCYLEDELCSKLEEFSRDVALRLWSCEGDEAVKLAGDSVAKEGSNVAKRIHDCINKYTRNCSEFSVATVTHDDGPTFSDMYHTLIHSPALDTLLQLEHTYALAMENSLQAWKNAREITAKRHDRELREKMAEVSSSRASEEELASLMREHERDKTVLEVQWKGEVKQLRETQKKTYHQWIDGAYQEMTSSDTSKQSNLVQSKRVGDGDDVFSVTGEEGGGGGGEGEFQQATSLEESFTIHLGAQLKSSHNIRLLCGHPLSLCRKRSGKHGGSGVLANPEQLQTALSLYSTKLTCLIIMTDNTFNGQIEKKFADICHRSTDLHFPDYTDQIAVIQDSLTKVCKNRASCGGGQQLESSGSSQTSERSTPRGGSPMSTFTMTTGGGGRGPMNGDMPSHQDPVMLKPGDFFITRHSNLSQVHVVLHLATDKDAVRDTGLRSRHPIMTGLRNCLHVAARNDVHHITVPLLLVHNMEPEMTIQWCLKRAEMVFKCVKGFMLENPLWGNGDSRTIQFLIPQSVSQDLFEEICEMLPKIFRVATTRKLISRQRTHSYK